MHLKNFSLIAKTPANYQLAPAYDLVATALATPNDKEELALTLKGRKSKFTLANFIEFAHSIGLPEKFVPKTITRLASKITQTKAMISQSFLPLDYQEAYHNLIDKRMARLELE